MLLKFSFVYLSIVLLRTGSNGQIDEYNKKAQSAETKENDSSRNQVVTMSIADLIKSLDNRINAEELNSKELHTLGTTDKVPEEVGLETKNSEPSQTVKADSVGAEIRVIIPKSTPAAAEKSLVVAVEKSPRSSNQGTQAELDTDSAVERYDEQINEKKELLDEIRRELESLRRARAALQSKRLGNLDSVVSKLSDFDKDEALYRRLMASNKHKPEKRLLLGSSSGACARDKLAQKILRIQANKELKIERSRKTADRVAELAIKSIQRQQRLAECVGVCGCDKDLGLDLGLGLGGGRGGLYRYLISCEDYDRRMILDMAIEDAASMIRRLAYETRGEDCVCGEDPEFERQCLKLAIELVNKVTCDDSSAVDLLSEYRYGSVDEYLRASIPRNRESGYCTCSEYDLAMGGSPCPHCVSRAALGLAPIYRYGRSHNGDSRDARRSP